MCFCSQQSKYNTSGFYCILNFFFIGIHVLIFFLVMESTCDCLCVLLTYESVRVLIFGLSSMQDFALKKKKIGGRKRSDEAMVR